MTRPTDIPEWAWAEAVRCAETVCRNLDYDDCTVEITAIARALMAAEARGRAEGAAGTDIGREQMDEWLTANCGSGIPHDESTDEATMLHGLAYVLRQIEATNSYRPHIGQVTSATSSLRMALDHFAAAAIRKRGA